MSSFESLYLQIKEVKSLYDTAEKATDEKRADRLELEKQNEKIRQIIDAERQAIDELKL